MQRRKAKKYIEENGLTITKARELIDAMPTDGIEGEMVSKVNKGLSQAQVKQIFLDGFDALEERRGKNFDLGRSYSTSERLFAQNVVRECM